MEFDLDLKGYGGRARDRPPLFSSRFGQVLHAPACAGFDIRLGKNLIGRIEGNLDDSRLLLALEQGFDQVAHIGRRTRYIEADVFVEAPVLQIVTGHLFAAAVGDDIDFAGFARVRDRRRTAQGHAVPEADQPAKIGILLKHGCRQCTCFAGVPVGRLVRDNLDFRMLLEDIENRPNLVDARRGGQYALDDCNLTRSTGTTLADKSVRLGFSDFQPVGADITVGGIAGTHIDLDDVYSSLFRLLVQTRIGLHVGIVNNNEVRLFADQLGKPLRTVVCAPIRIAYRERAAVGQNRLPNAARPSFSKIETHRKRKEDDLLALQGLDIGRPAGIDQSIGHRGR